MGDPSDAAPARAVPEVVRRQHLAAIERLRAACDVHTLLWLGLVETESLEMRAAAAEALWSLWTSEYVAEGKETRALDWPGRSRTREGDPH